MNGASIMRIGIDFDNTIAGYDEVFAQVARAENLIDPSLSGLTKRKVRDLVRIRDDGENDWIRLQSLVYGRHMHAASLLQGFESFIHRCRRCEAEVYVVSHKTEFGRLDPERVNLRQAAMRWMHAKGFFSGEGLGLAPHHVYFEETRIRKIERIAALECTHFIDDLEEVLSEPSFPAFTRRILLADHTTEPSGGPFEAFRTWHEIEKAIFEADA